MLVIEYTVIQIKHQDQEQEKNLDAWIKQRCNQNCKETIWGSF